MASIIDVFGMWRHEYHEDNSLMSLLTLQALKEGCLALANQNDNAIHASGTSWRIGVHLPVKEAEIEAHAVQMTDERKASQVNWISATTHGCSTCPVYLASCRPLCNHLHFFLLDLGRGCSCAVGYEA